MAPACDLNLPTASGRNERVSFRQTMVDTRSRKRPLRRASLYRVVSDRGTTTEPTRASHRAAAEAFVSRARNRVGDAIVNLYVFGSTARDEARGLSSDVDVLVVLSDGADRDVVDDSLHDIAYDVMLEHGPVVELHILSEREFERDRRGNPFLRRVVSEGRSYA